MHDEICHDEIRVNFFMLEDEKGDVYLNFRRFFVFLI